MPRLRGAVVEVMAGRWAVRCPVPWPGPVAVAGSRCWPLWLALVAGLCGWSLWLALVAGPCGWPLWLPLWLALLWPSCGPVARWPGGASSGEFCRPGAGCRGLVC